MMSASSPPVTMLVPDFPFSYDDWLRHPAGLGVLPQAAHGTEVAVVGAGMAGMTAAYELLRLGLRPVVYEAGRIGGRMRSVPFPGDPSSVAEMGAMRFPVSARALFHYIDLLGLGTRPFPNPLAADTPATVIDLAGRREWARTAADLPDVFHEVSTAWEKSLQERAELSVLRGAIQDRDTATLKKVWDRLVGEYDDTSFYGFLASSPAFRSFRHREIFGQVGFGSGGWDTDFPNSMLEILRVVVTDADTDHLLLEGGSERLPRGLWTRSPEDLVHWPAGTTLASLHGGAPLPGVTAMRARGPEIEITDASGAVRRHAAVVFTPHVWTLLNRIDCDASLLSTDQWTAVERTHYMGSSKLFVLTDRPFWRDIDPRTGRETMGMTLTDRSARGVYLFDQGPDRPGVMCLSYTWNDDSLKFATLSERERLDVLLARLADIYPDVDIRSHIIDGPLGVTWETEPHFMGAFRANLPGQYRYQRRLFTQFAHGAPVPDGPHGTDGPNGTAGSGHDGLFLCGDGISWTPGFAEGAVTTALNAVWGVLHRLGGHTHAANPGPGDHFDFLAPVVLPYD